MLLQATLALSLVGCVGERDYDNVFKARLEKIWLQQAVKFVNCIGLGLKFPTCTGLCWVESVI